MHYILCCFIALLMATAAYANPAFTLQTTAFPDKGPLPVVYTCNGKEISPELSWRDIPEKTKSLALILSDPDAPNGTFYHWVLYNIPKSITTLPEGMTNLPAGATIGKNSVGETTYNGPCPPKHTVHRYYFTLYALDSTLDLKAADASTLLQAMQPHIVGETALSAVYTQWP